LKETAIGSATIEREGPSLFGPSLRKERRRFFSSARRSRAKAVLTRSNGFVATVAKSLRIAGVPAHSGPVNEAASISKEGGRAPGAFAPLEPRGRTRSLRVDSRQAGRTSEERVSSSTRPAPHSLRSRSATFLRPSGGRRQLARGRHPPAKARIPLGENQRRLEKSRRPASPARQAPLPTSRCRPAIKRRIERECGPVGPGVQPLADHRCEPQETVPRLPSRVRHDPETKGFRA